MYPPFFSSLAKGSIVVSSNRNSNTTRFKTGIIQHEKVEYCDPRRGQGGIHISLNNNNNNNNNELYLHDHTSTCSIAKAIFKNQNYITGQLCYFDNNLARTSKQAEIYFMHRDMCIPCFFFSCYKKYCRFFLYLTQLVTQLRLYWRDTHITRNICTGIHISLVTVTPDRRIPIHHLNVDVLFVRHSEIR